MNFGHIGVASAGFAPGQSGPTNSRGDWVRRVVPSTDKDSDKTARDLLLDLINSDMNVARAFTAVARAAYNQGKTEEGDAARFRAKKFFSEARQSLLQVTELDKRSALYDFEKLRDDIESLAMPSGALPHCSVAPQESDSSHALLKFVKRIPEKLSSILRRREKS